MNNNNNNKKESENAIINIERIWSFKICRSLLAVELTRGMCGARNINRIYGCVNSVTYIFFVFFLFLNIFLSFSFRTILHFLLFSH